jgi:hypothetical protein
VNVADTEPLGGLDVGRHAIDADDGPDAELLEGREGFDSVRVAAAVEPRAQAERVLDARDFEPLRGFQLILLGRFVEGLLLAIRCERDHGEAEEEYTNPKGNRVPLRHRTPLVPSVASGVVGPPSSGPQAGASRRIP